MSRGPRNRGSSRGPSGGAGRRPRGSNAGPAPASGSGCGFTIPLLPVLICLALIRAAVARLTRKDH